MSSGSSDLFAPDVPDGFRYQSNFIGIDEEALLAEEIHRLQFSTFEMRGGVARRRVAFFPSGRFGRNSSTVAEARRAHSLRRTTAG